MKNELNNLQLEEEALIFDRRFDMQNREQSLLLEAKRIELLNNLDYFEEAKQHIAKLWTEIMNEKLKNCAENEQSSTTIAPNDERRLFQTVAPTT